MIKFVRMGFALNEKACGRASFRFAAEPGGRITGDRERVNGRIRKKNFAEPAAAARVGKLKKRSSSVKTRRDTEGEIAVI